MTPFAATVVELTRDALAALADRQRRHAVHRGEDTDRGRRVEPAAALRSLLAEPVIDTDPQLIERWEAAMDHPATMLLERLALSDEERLVVMVATALEIEPCLGPMVACLTDAPSLRHATVTLLDATGRAFGHDLHAVRRALDPSRRLACLQLVSLQPGISESFGDRVVLPDEWLVQAMIRDGIASRPRDRDLCWLIGKPDGDAHVAGGPLLCSDPDVATDAAAWADEDGVPAFAVVGLVGQDAGRCWDDEPVVVEAARQCLAEGAALIVRTSARARTARPSCEALADLGVPIALHDPHAASFPVPGRWRRLARAGPRRMRLGTGDVDAAWSELSMLASPLDTAVGWEDLAVDARTERHLHDVASAILSHSIVIDAWGFGARPGAVGISVLFNGPSGTGKTLAARVLAGVVGLDLWLVDLARVTDKYLGESEKHLDRLLTAAAASGAVLLFDEAEAIFGRRAETREARDRWANLEIAYLLQRIEHHPGVTVLTTNLGQQLDDAFDRRIGHRIEFLRPDATMRRRLWREMMPRQAPLADPDDLVLLANRFELTGGMIRNAALNAAYAAAGEPGPPLITLAHLVRASVRELAKSGTSLTRAELGPLAALLEHTNDRVS